MKTQACAYDERVFTTTCRCDIIRYKSIYGEYLWSVLTRREQEIPHFYKNATEKVVSLVSQGVKYVQKCSLIIKYC